MATKTYISAILAWIRVKARRLIRDVDEGIQVGDGSAVAELGTFDTQRLGLGVDALGGRALIVESLVETALPVAI